MPKFEGKSTKQLQEERAVLVTQARAYNDEHEDSWSEENEKAYSKMMDDVSSYKAAIDRRTSLDAALDRKHEEFNDQISGGEAKERKIMIRHRGEYVEVPAGPRGSAAYEEAFELYLTHGARGLQPEQLAALQSDNASQAGYLTSSEQFASGLLKDIDDLLFIRRYARVHQVPQAATLGIRKRTAKASTFDWSAELQVSSEDTSLTFGKKVLTPHPMTGLIKASRDLLRRGVLPVESIIRDEMSIDAAEKEEDGFMTGDGSQKPLGVFTASSDGISTSRDVDTGSATSITADSLRDAKYSLKAGYRGMGPRWLFHRDGIKIVSKLKDADNQYLWQPGLTQGDPDRLLSFAVDESERAPNTFTTGQYVGLLAVWRFYEIADALDIEIQVLTEKYAETNQVGFIGRLKVDGMPTLEEGFARLQTS